MNEKIHNVALREVAPPNQAEMPGEDETVWNLSLEDIESVSGKRLRVVTCRVGDLGSSKCAFDSRHVLYSKLRPYLNKVALPDRAGVGTSELIPLLPDPNRLDREYLAFYLRSPGFVHFATSSMQGANLPRVSMSDFWQHKLTLPELRVQRRVVARIKDCLSRVEEMQRLRKEISSENGSLESSFVDDFLSSSAVSRAARVTLGKVLRRAQYGTSQKADADSSGTPILRMGNIQRGRVVATNGLKYVKLCPADLQAYRLIEGDILFNRTNSFELVGKSGVFTGLSGDWVFASYLIRLIADRKRVLPEFVSTLINSSLGRSFIEVNARRAIGQVNINAKQIATFEIPDLALAAQESFIETLTKIRHASDDIEEQLTETEFLHLREAILREAFAGNL